VILEADTGIAGPLGSEVMVLPRTRSKSSKQDGVQCDGNAAGEAYLSSMWMSAQRQAELCVSRLRINLAENGIYLLALRFSGVRARR
jgi:hypothetical protein